MTRRAKIETGDVAGPEEQVVDLSSTIEKPEPVIASSGDMENPATKEYMRWIAFMEEEVMISIALSDNPNAENPVTCGNNGEIKRLERGKPYRIKRKFLDSLIKTTFKVVTEQYEDDNGLKQTRIRRKPAAAYPISILDHGPNPELSQRWFQFRCQEPV